MRHWARERTLNLTLMAETTSLTIECHVAIESGSTLMN